MVPPPREQKMPGSTNHLNVCRKQFFGNKYLALTLDKVGKLMGNSEMVYCRTLGNLSHLSHHLTGKACGRGWAMLIPKHAS